MKLSHRLLTMITLLQNSMQHYLNQLQNNILLFFKNYF
jgi:hypothetical protein